MSGEVTFAATEADYIAANRLWHGRSGRQRWLLWLGAAGALLALVNVAFRMMAGATLLDALDDSLAIIIFTALILSVRTMTPLALPRQVRRMMNQNRSLREPVRCIWNDEGIFFSGSNGTADLRWDDLHRWIADETSFVFLQSDRLMLILPHRALNDTQAEDLRRTAANAGLPRQ